MKKLIDYIFFLKHPSPPQYDDSSFEYNQQNNKQPTVEYVRNADLRPST